MHGLKSLNKKQNLCKEQFSSPTAEATPFQCNLKQKKSNQFAWSWSNLLQLHKFSGGNGHFLPNMMLPSLNWGTRGNLLGLIYS